MGYTLAIVMIISLGQDTIIIKLVKRIRLMVNQGPSKSETVVQIQHSLFGMILLNKFGLFRLRLLNRFNIKYYRIDSLFTG